MNCKKFGRAAASMALVMSVVSTSAMAAPADLMGHDSLYIWDYHLTNYDKNGNIRATPEKTTFALPGDRQDSGIPEYYAPDAVISETAAVDTGSADRSRFSSVTRVSATARGWMPSAPMTAAACSWCRSMKTSARSMQRWVVLLRSVSNRAMASIRLPS